MLFRSTVKEPKIMMADEPTGALDSATGKAILDTLKELSESRLIIVVSHDREFAEEYGDRIIELADGEVIADSRAETTVEITVDSAQNEMKKSKLPYRRAIAMGAKTMHKKRLRLAITILLCFLSFTFFGIVDIMATFDKVYAAQTVLSCNDDFISFNGVINYKDGKWNKSGRIASSYADLDELRDMTGLDFQGVLGEEWGSLNLWNKDILNDGKEYYTGRYSGILPASQEFFKSQKYELIGRMPENEKEIVITKYIFEQYSRAGFVTNDVYIPPEEIDGIANFLNKKPTISKMDMGGLLYGNMLFPDLTIVGVVDTKADPDGRIKNMNLEKNYYNQIARQYFSRGYHSLFYVHQSLYDYVLNSYPKPDSTGFGRTVPVYIDGYSFEGAAKSQALNKKIGRAHV